MAKGACDMGFSVGVEVILPGGNDWWATIYSAWFGKHFREESLGKALRELGADYTLFYDSLAPGKVDACGRIADMCGRLDIPFLLNNTYGDIQGPWIPGTGRADYGEARLRDATATGKCLGLVWDEVAHRQINAVDTGDGPYFFDATGLDVGTCHDRLVAEVTRIVGEYEAHGVASVAELVFPVLMHPLACAGMTPAPKVLKESFNPLVLAIAMGAALQYGRPLWAVADLWGVIPFWGTIFHDDREGNPGHSPDEYLSALLLCYWLGLDSVYTEGLYDLIVPVHTTPEEWEDLRTHPIHHRGADNPLVMNVRRDGYMLTAYGKYHRWFAKQYVPAHSRPFTFRDVRPRVAVIALSDSTWCRRGASSFASSDTLFGPTGPAKQARHEAILDAFHLLTHGAVPREGITWHNEPMASRHQAIAEQIRRDGRMAYPYADDHTGFCPLDGVVVFDHQVAEEHLRGISLLICTGEALSEETQMAVWRCIRSGARCVTLPHLFPEMSARYEGTPFEVKIGAGAMLVTEDLMAESARRWIERELGASDQVHYRFGAWDVTLAPRDGDERRLDVSVQNVGEDHP